MASLSQSVVEVNHITLRHPNAPEPVLQDTSLAIADGEFVAIVGGSGVGKSTLLRAVSGLLQPEYGEIRVNIPPAADRRTRAVVFQDSRLLPWRRVWSNVALGLKGLNLTKAEAEARVAAALELTGLSGFAERWPHQLSGGQAQRVGIARALAVQPAILAMDEPFSAVDAITRANLQDELVRIWQASGAAVLFVTHDIGEAVYLADRIIVLSGAPARIVADIKIDPPRPRPRDEPKFAELAETVAKHLLPR